MKAHNKLVEFSFSSWRRRTELANEVESFSTWFSYVYFYSVEFLQNFSGLPKFAIFSCHRDLYTSVVSASNICVIVAFDHIVLSA